MCFCLDSKNKLWYYDGCKALFMLLFFQVIMYCLYNGYDFGNNNNANKAFLRDKLIINQKKIKQNGNNNFRPACFCMGIYREQRRTAHLLQKRNRRRRKILRCLVCHLILAGILYCRRKVFYGYYRRLCIRIYFRPHYEAKDICKIQILKKKRQPF